VDQESRCCAIIKENLEKTGMTAKARVHCTTVGRAINSFNEEFDIVLMDPPYKDTGIGTIIEQLAASKAVGPDTTVVITHSSRFKFQPQYGALVIKREIRHGDSTIAIFRKEQSI